MKQIITSTQAPKAIGPYSQAVKVGSLLFVSGQVALDPVLGALVTGDVVVQTKQVMENLRAVLAAAKLTFANVVKTTIYVTDLAAFASINETYGAYFTEPFPARATIQVAALPKGAVIEIDCIATYD